DVFVIESGRATFRVGDVELVGEAGQIVVAPANAYHGFTNSGTDELRLTAIHTAPAFDTEWLGEPEPDWVTPPPLPPARTCRCLQQTARTGSAHRGYSFVRLASLTEVRWTETTSFAAARPLSCSNSFHQRR